MPDLLKAEHFLHLRCEVPALDMLALFDTVADHALVRMVSLMDHSPGVGQYADLDFYRALRRRGGLDDAVYRTPHRANCRSSANGCAFRNRRALLDRVAGRDIALASHDDRTEEEIAENAADGIGISEFPVTMEAAQAAKAAGMQVIAGAPNIVRGGSHSGNVAAARSAGERRGRCVRFRLRAEQPGGSGVPMRAGHRPAAGGRAGDRQAGAARRTG